MIPINSPAEKLWKDSGNKTLVSISQNQNGFGHLSSPVMCEEGVSLALPPGWAVASTSAGWWVSPQPPTSSVRPPTTLRGHCLSLVCLSCQTMVLPEGNDRILLICRSPMPGIAPGTQWALNKWLLKEWTNVIGEVYNPGIVINSKLILSQFLAVAYGHIKPWMIYDALFNTTTKTDSMK